ncbi:MAG: hypothetical protein ACRYFX_19750 [Janthinobacterium lividum]
MRLNQAPDPPPALPNIRDLHELLHQHLPPPLILKLTPLPELERRLEEITAEHPRFREEAPLVLAGEQQRRQRLSGTLRLAAPARVRVA